MSLISAGFIIFFLSVLFVYNLLPLKYQNVWLLLSSYFFYFKVGKWESFYFIAGVTILTFGSGLILNRINKKNARIAILAINILILTALLVFLRLFAKGFLNSKADIIIPVGISFFTLQAIGYLIDVYRGNFDAERSFINYALFLGFFIYILSGPIERAGNILTQIRVKRKINYKGLCHGLQLMLWGFFLKLVMAERFLIVVQYVYGDYTYFSGIELFITTIMYSLYIYCDFTGYSNIAVGMGEAMGFNVIQNFNEPYFSKSISEFWRKWHISLSSWLKDYIYIPLGGAEMESL